MAQEHFDRLTAIDASFLAQEGPSSHMHIGALTILEGPPPPFGDFLDIIRGRLHLVPRYRQRLSFPPVESGRPVWVDDPSFNLEYHVRQTALPRPGTRGAALQARLADLLPAARPLEAAVGDVGDRGARGRPLGADLQDAPRGHRRDLRRRPRDGHVRPHAASRARSSIPTRRGSRRPSRRPRRWSRPAPSASRAPPPTARGASCAWRRTRRRCSPRCATARGPRRDRLGRPEPRPGHAAERRDRPAPPLPRRARPTSPTSS